MTDAGSHGTHVAGIIAANAENGIGISGASYGTRIMPVRVFNEFGFGFETQMAEGLAHASQHGAQIASMSLGFPSAGSVLHDAIKDSVFDEEGA